MNASSRPAVPSQTSDAVFSASVQRAPFAGQDIIGSSGSDEGFLAGIVSQEAVADRDPQVIDAQVATRAATSGADLGKDAVLKVPPGRAGLGFSLGARRLRPRTAGGAKVMAGVIPPSPWNDAVHRRGEPFVRPGQELNATGNLSDDRREALGCLCRGGAALWHLSQSASVPSREKTPPTNSGSKHGINVFTEIQL